jgi:3D (Asp-Asp-Asp) domain-containing protein
MNLIQRIASVTFAIILSITSTAGVYAETNQDQLNEKQQQLQQSNASIQQKIQQQKQIEQQIQSIQKEIESGNQVIAEIEKESALMRENIERTRQQIEKKKAEIIMLENKVENRKEVMRNRIVSIQNNDSASLLVEILINAENLADFLEKMNAVVTILDADKNILKMQQEDLERIEKDKEIISQKEKLQEAENAKLEEKKAERAAQLQKKQEASAALQAKYTELSNLITLDEQQKKTIETSIKGIQEAIAREEAAKKAADSQPAAAQPSEKSSTSEEPSTSEKPLASGKEIYVEATAYSVEESLRHGQGKTAAGYDVGKNPNMKLIAVDPKIIPLGKRVWVEGYGEAIAGDTGSDIKNYRIDVLVPTDAEAARWGRKNVKVIILD